MDINVGVIGAGTVGGGVVQTLLDHADTLKTRAGGAVRLTHVADVNLGCLAEFDLSGVKVSSDAEALIADPDVDVVCELIGGTDPARGFILKALEAGKSVVTANKMLLACHGRELCDAATRNKVDLRYEAAVAGGIPIIKALRESLAANNIEFVYGILNGTCNYILTRMTYEGLEFEEVLQQAIEQGFAETPPDLDVEGHDTAHKAQIIASLCYSTEVDLDDIHVEGITSVAHSDVAYALEMGYVIKLLAVIRSNNGDIEVRVHPTLVPQEHLLASVRYEFNAVYVQGDVADATLYYGRGAGRLPTASAVIADIVDIARRGQAPAMKPFTYEEKRRIRPVGDIEGRYYLRLRPLDKPGVLARICDVLGQHGVSIASCMQKEEHEEDKPVDVVLMTHETRESPLRDATAQIDSLDFITESTHTIRVL